MGKKPNQCETAEEKTGIQEKLMFTIWKESRIAYDIWHLKTILHFMIKGTYFEP